MKLLYISVLILLVSSSAHASGFIPVIDGNTSSPNSLFQFQVDGSTNNGPTNNGLEQGPMPKDYESVIDGSHQISTSVAWQNGFMDDHNLAFSYLDGPSGGKPGGLGVCKELSGNQCADSGDDSIGRGESIMLNINKPVRVGNIYFTNGNHDDDFFEFAGVNIYIDDVKVIGNLFNDAWGLTPVLSALADMVITESIKFEWAAAPVAIACKVEEECKPLDPNLSDFYIDGFGKPVPVPAAVWLFGSALVGLTGLRRRQKL